MSKFYAVELTTTAIVQVEDHQDAGDAEMLARELERDILRDTLDMEIGSVMQVRSQRQLTQHGWDGMCIPYGGDGDTRLQDLLPPDLTWPA